LGGGQDTSTPAHVIPAKAGIQAKHCHALDPGFRRDDSVVESFGFALVSPNIYPLIIGLTT
jgi:hypothetical protein